jgi:hypothetical protein
VNAFARAADAIAADPNIGADALYTPQGEAAFAVRVVLSRVDDGMGVVAPQRDGWAAMLPMSSVPDRPIRGEALSVGTRDFEIEEAMADEASAAWSLRLRKVGAWV